MSITTGAHDPSAPSRHLPFADPAKGRKSSLSHAYFSEMFQYTGTDALSAPSTFDRMARTR